MCPSARWYNLTRYLVWLMEPVRGFLSRDWFMKLHYAYFLTICTIASLVFWGTSTPAQTVRFIDAVFLTVSAMTEAGLNTVNLSTLNTFQQIVLFVLIIVGSGTFVSCTVIIIRKRAFEASLQKLADHKWAKKQRQSITHSPIRIRTSAIKTPSASDTATNKPTSFDEVVTRPRNEFRKLTSKEKRQLGGIEYEALCLLSWVVPLYVILFQLFGAIGCGAWVQLNRPNIAMENGLNPFWTGTFFAISAFNNCGMALLDLNMTVFQDSYYLLLTMSFLILAGNTCFPPFLRLILWTMKRCLASRVGSNSQRWQRVIEFTLDHPRRVYTHLFPSQATWWLVLSLILLNGADWFAFEVFNLTNPVINSIPARFRALDGLFQAFAVRAGGFYVVNIAALYPATQVLYVLMMYLSAFPVTMTMRATNIYDENSLSIVPGYRQSTSHMQGQSDLEGYAESGSSPLEAHIRKIQAGSPTPFHEESMQPDINIAPTIDVAQRRRDFVRHQLRLQLGHDLWLLALACLLITLIETASFSDNPVAFSVFNILFEIVSGYGTVGISVGVPWANYSFSGAWHSGSKLVLCVVMLRGRHRGLPGKIDRAVLLPDESLAWAEEEPEEDKNGQLTREGDEIDTTTMDDGPDMELSQD